MKYTKFFNSNPSVSGNNAMSNIEALAKFDTWLAGQKIISITAGEAQEGYTTLTFTKENGDTYTVNVPTLKGDTGAQGPSGDTGLEGLSITSVYKATATPTPNAGFTLTVDDFNRTPTTNERAVMFAVTGDSTALPEVYITSIVVNSISENTVNCMYESVQLVEVNSSPANEFNYIGEWVENNEYHKNDCVIVSKTITSFGVDVICVCIEDINSSTIIPTSDSTHWIVIGTTIASISFTDTQYEDNELEIGELATTPIGSVYLHYVVIKYMSGGVEGVINVLYVDDEVEVSISNFKLFLGKYSNDKRKYYPVSGVINNTSEPKPATNINNSIIYGIRLQDNKFRICGYYNIVV